MHRCPSSLESEKWGGNLERGVRCRSNTIIAASEGAPSVDQSQGQASNVHGCGNIVVQIVGDGNVANLVPRLPALWLTTYDSPLYAEVQSVPPGASHPAGYTATGKEEAGLLSPFTRALTMLGRDRVVQDLFAWLESPRPISVQVVVGGGGRGKTRLALELCAAARAMSWLAGFVVRDEFTRFRDQQALATWGWNRPLLAVVDYAAAKAEMLAGWLAELTHHRCWMDPSHPKLRLLLLERQGSPEDAWWRLAFGEGGPARDAIRRMLAPGAPVMLGPLRDPVQRQAIFAEAYRLASGTTPPPIADLDRLLERQSLGGEPLFLAMAGLSAARMGIAGALAQAPDELAINLAAQELSRVRAVWSGRGLPISEEKRLDHHLAAVATLCEGLSETEAHLVIAREAKALHLSATQGTEPIRAALHAALPAEAGGIAPILPDILGEAALIATWGTGEQGKLAITRAAAAQRKAVTRVVVRACQDFLVRGQRAPLDWLRILRAGATDAKTLVALADAMPARTTELREAAAEITQAAIDALASAAGTDNNNEQASALRATGLSNLSARLSDLGRCEAALAASEEAVAIGRRLVATRPGAFLSDLASWLSNLSNHLSNLGRREAALAASEEAVAIRRRAAILEPDKFLPDLANSLNGMSLRLSGLGRGQAALAAIEEAVSICRGLAATRAEAFEPKLAMSLTNLASRLSDLGRPEAALAEIDEAVAIYRGLAAAQPDAFTPDLATSLNNLSNRLSELGHREEALASIEEAVALRRALVVARPNAFASDWARELTNLADRLSDLGRAEAALAASEQAVAAHRGLEVADPVGFAPGLALSLLNLADRLGGVGRWDAALLAAEEALAVFRRLSADNPDAFLPDVAKSLNNVATALSSLGHNDRALAATEEAVRLYRSLVEHWSAPPKAAARADWIASKLAGSLYNLALHLVSLDRREAALVAIEQAVAIRRRLAAPLPDAFAPDLARALGVWGDLALPGDAGKAVALFEEGLRVLSPLFLAHPRAHVAVMRFLCAEYLSACAAAGRRPDDDLLEPLAAPRGDRGPDEPPQAGGEGRMIPEALVAEAVKAAIGALTKEAVGPALAAGGRVWAWVKGKLTGTEAQASVTAVEADPTKASARHKLFGALLELLEVHPGLANELDQALRESGYREAVAQTATVTGNQNTTAQMAGQGNTLNIGRNGRSDGEGRGG